MGKLRHAREGRQYFQVFTDKAAAINFDNGVNDQLTTMLLKWHQPRQKLAVGKPEYKTIIEAKLGIPCLFDEPVMEVMRGLNYLLHSFVPEEKSNLADGDCLRTSQGLKMLLDRYGFDVKPHMVNECIIETACMLHDCDKCLKSISESWCSASAFLEVVSSINSQDWDTLKIATALKMVCYPKEKIVFGDPHEMFSADELSKLVTDAHKYEDCGIMKGSVSRLYARTVFMYQSRTKSQRRLSRRIKRRMKLNEK
ncbi:hypothetical protein ACQJBY_059063 [Aegilops geniculata]